jgi:hypothetical protein
MERKIELFEIAGYMPHSLEIFDVESKRTYIPALLTIEIL